MDPIELALPPPLHYLLGLCEIRCVYGCCGLQAFEFNPAAVRGWVKRFGQHAPADAVGQLEAVIATCRDEPRGVSCDLLCHTARDAASRDELVTFFVDLQRSLAALG